ncbi:hypothetical protein CPB83DRAFT_66758 [Crepidotus variabilis]|uniref:DUF6533 domain-containing protein n=1 Tax=Crepidotus variabilis TaxID=179855 RepID=A0A9P6JJL6_9AGAR|nr:hypothetical protein CPB83DRAFT_66758 [Crepidotus variabilis]
MSALPTVADIITLTVSRTIITRYPVVACYAVLSYEFFLVLDQEYRLIYRSRWTLLKCLYLACRFIPLILWPVNMYSFMNDHTLPECMPLVVFGSLSYIPLLAIPQCIYVFRAWSITGRKRSIFCFLGLCLGGYLGVLIWAATDNLTVSRGAFTLLKKTGCYRPTYDNYNAFARPIFAAIALDSVVATVLIIHHYFTTRRSAVQGRLVRLVFNQDTFFFPIILVLNVITSVILTRPVRYLDRTALVAVIVMSNIIACRFILQIRELTRPTELSVLRQMSLQVRKDLGRVQTVLSEIGDETPSPLSSAC